MKKKELREISKDELRNILGGERGEVKPLNLTEIVEKQVAEEDCLYQTCASCATCQTNQGGSVPDTMRRVSYPLPQK